MYSASVPGAYFTQASRRGHWDGKKYYINKKGQFRTGLLPYILKDLEKIECIPELNFENTPDLNLNSPEIPNFRFYDFQKDAVNYALENKRCVIQSPTGSGKTLIIAGVVKALSGYKGVLFFNSKHILRQTYEFLLNSGVENVGLCYSKGMIQKDIMLTTPKSLHKILDTHLEDSQFILVDEAHEFANGELSLNAIQSFPQAQYRIGFTATPPTTKIPKLNLVGALGEIHRVVSTKDLVEDNKLTKPLIQIFDLDYPIPIKNAADALNYRELYVDYIVENEYRNNMVVDIIHKIKTKVSSAKILILVKDLNHLQKFKDLIPGAITIEGYDDLTERYEKIREFKEQEFSVIIGTRVLQTGVNIEEITHMINARGLKSKMATIQALGRSLRKSDNKTKVYFYDIVDKLKYLSGHGESRYRAYKKEGHEIKRIKVMYENPKGT